MVTPLSTNRPSTWLKTGECVASSASARNVRPGQTTATGSSRVSSERTCTGEVWVRRTRPLPSGSTNSVSCISRAGWSPPKLSASKLNHSCSTSGPSATSQPIAMKTSQISSWTVVSGCRAPIGSRGGTTVTSTASSTRTRASRSASRAVRRSSYAAWTACRTTLTRLPASDRSSVGSEPSARRASASGARSPRCAVRSAGRSARVAVAANAASAAAQAASSCAGSSRERSGADTAGSPGVVSEVGSLPEGARRQPYPSKGGRPAGSRNRNCAPPLGERPTSMLPPWASISPLTM